VIETGQDPRRFTEDVLRRLRDLVIVSAVPEAHASGLLDAPQDQAERLIAQAARFGRADLVRAADLVAAGLTEMRGATTPRLLLELLCAKVLLPGADHAELGLLARMDRLERRLDVAGSGPLDLVARRAPQQPAPARTPEAEPPAPRLPDDVAPTGPRLPEEVAQRPSRGAVTETPETPGTPEPPAPAAPAETGAEAPGQLSLADVRRLWPDLLEQVKRMRRFTWILLSQNAQVIGIDQRSLTVGFKTAGARDSFLGGGSEEILRQAAIDMVGADWKIETVVDSSADPGAQGALRVTRAAVPEAPEPSDTPESPGPGPVPGAGSTTPAPASGAARARIAATRGPGPAAAEPDGSAPAADPDADAHRDDPASADNGIDTTELLARELGATVIEDIPHS
jgi:DNA polymerase-3 subunit gamma/tau